MRDPNAAGARLRELKAVGVRLAIDDFGTGYSSLLRLREFPVDLLKVAREFVDGVGTSASQEAMVRTIVTLAQNLGLDVVGEGIETPGQVTALGALGCGLGQGHHYARPMSAAAIDNALAEPAYTGLWASVGPGSFAS